MVSEAKIKEVRERLRGLGVKYCIGAYVDIHGVPKAKVVPLDHLGHMAHGDLAPLARELARSLRRCIGQ